MQWKMFFLLYQLNTNFYFIIITSNVIAIAFIR